MSLITFNDTYKWKMLDKSNIRHYDIVNTATREFTEMMKNMSPADLAQAVPYIEIFELSADGTRGKLLSTDLVRTPKFGVIMSQFGERPDVSLEKVSIKYAIPQGWILFRELDLTITVHRPDAVFNAPGGSLMQSLLDFSKEHVIYYGWRGGNSIIAHGFTSKSNPAKTNSAVDARDIVPVKGVVRFKVTNYNFTIENDLQVKFTIHAIEDGELATRDAVIMNNHLILPLLENRNLSLMDAEAVCRLITQVFTDELARKKIDKWINVTDPGDPKKSKRQLEQFIAVKDIFNIFFADPIGYGAQCLGYKNIQMYLGVINERVPLTTAPYGEMNYAGQSIGGILLPLKQITDLAGKMITANSQITVYGFMKQIMSLIGGYQIWDTSPTDTKMVPELTLRTKYNIDTGTAMYQVIDRKYYIANGDVKLEENQKNPKAELRKKIKDKNIPAMSLGNSLSFIKDAKFEVVNDEQMKSIFVLRRMQQTRAQILGDNRSSQVGGGMPGFAMMYRSAIKGSITILGNFAFDVFNLIWFDFGIPAYNGLFYIVGRTDEISADGFFTTLNLQAEGSDPLKNQLGGKSRPDPKWQTGRGARSMIDWVKSMIVEKQMELTPEQIQGIASKIGTAPSAAKKNSSKPSPIGNAAAPVTTSKTSPLRQKMTPALQKEINEMAARIDANLANPNWQPPAPNVGVVPIPPPGPGWVPPSKKK